MPLLSFSVLRDLIETGKKTQTIRLPRKKNSLVLNDKLFIYWKCRTQYAEKIGEGIIVKLNKKRVCDLTDQDAILDGFIGRTELLQELFRLHPDLSPLQMVDVITWHWTYKENHSWFATDERLRIRTQNNV